MQQQEVEMRVEPAQDWFVYLIRAASGALYCGCTTDPARRFAQHAGGRGARFFRSSPAVALVYVERCAGRGAALAREAAIKRLGKAAKERLVQGAAGAASGEWRASS